MLRQNEFIITKIECGGISCNYEGGAELNNTAINNTTAEGYGGGVYAANVIFTMSESDIYENIAESGGGEITENTTIEEANED